MGELAERLQVQHHSAVGLVDRLVSETLIRREASQEDRRQVHLRLTLQGEEVLSRLVAVHREQFRRIGPNLAELLKQLSRDDAA